MRLGRFAAAPLRAGKDRNNGLGPFFLLRRTQTKARKTKQREREKEAREGRKRRSGEIAADKSGGKRSRRISERREARFGPGAPSRRTGRQGGRLAKKGSAPFGCANAPTGCGQGLRPRPLRPKARRCLDETLETPLRAAAQIAQPRRGPGQAPRDPNRNALGQAARAVAA